MPDPERESNPLSPRQTINTNIYQALAAPTVAAIANNGTRESALAFDVRDGRRIDERDLFSATGRKALARLIRRRNRRAIGRARAALRHAARRRKLAAEDLRVVDEMYAECFEEWRQVEVDAALGDVRLGPQDVTFTQSRCSPHVLRALDALGVFKTTLSVARLTSWLSPYGLTILGSGTAAQRSK